MSGRAPAPTGACWAQALAGSKATETLSQQQVDIYVDCRAKKNTPKCRAFVCP